MIDTRTSFEDHGSERVYWTFQFAGWGIYTAARFIGGLTVIQLPWTHLAVELLLLNSLGLGASHGLRHYVRSRHWRSLPARKLSWKIVAAAFMVALPMGIATQFTELSALNDPTPELERFAPGLGLPYSWWISAALEVLNWAVLFGVWLTAYFSLIGVREYRSAQLKQSELARALHLAELRLLKSQLNPHFLFNALNTVRSLISEDPGRAHRAVSHLAATLRYSLGSRHDECVTLSQELAIVADYLELESMRFEDRLKVEMHIPDIAHDVPIPVMMLQSLVENAIKHGIAELPAGGVLSISAVVQDQMLLLEVRNPRPIVVVGSNEEGVGLRNAHDRLRLLFDGRASLDLDLSQPGIATARVRIPVTT